MSRVIRMDFYRLTKMLSFKVCLSLVFLLNLVGGPLEKIIYDLAKTLVKEADPNSLEQIGEFPKQFHLGNMVASPLGGVPTVLLLLCIVWFCSADIQHGYIKNIAGQLPSRGHTIVSKFVVTQITTIVFIVAASIGDIIGQLMIGRTLVADFYLKEAEGVVHNFSLAASFGELAVKWILLTAICALILLFTTALGSNVIGTIVAVLCGLGLTGAAYLGISSGINALFRLKEGNEFDLSNFMPDSLYHSNILVNDAMLRSLIVGIISVCLIMFFTVTLYNKKDIK